MSLNIFLTVDGKNINLYQTTTEVTKMIFEKTNGVVNDKTQIKKMLEGYFLLFKSKLNTRSEKIDFNNHKVQILNYINLGQNVCLFLN